MVKVVIFLYYYPGGAWQRLAEPVFVGCSPPLHLCFPPDRAPAPSLTSSSLPQALLPFFYIINIKKSKYDDDYSRR